MKQKTNKLPESSKPSSIKQALLGLYGIVGISLSAFGGFKVPFAESNAKDYWRHALAGIILVIALLAGLVSFALYMFNANYFKSQIVEYVKENNQRDLTLDGDLKVTFFPQLGLDAGKMTLSQRNSSKIFASIENARFHIAWWPMFIKQLQIESVSLEGVHANITRYKTGGTNLNDFFASDWQLSNIKFEIDSIKLANSSINLIDEPADRIFSLHDLNLETGKLADTTPGDISANFRLESSKPKIDTKVKLNSHLLFDLKTRSYTLANFEAEMEGEIAGLNTLNLSMQGSIHGNQATEELTLDKFTANAKGKFENRKLDAKIDINKLQLKKNIITGTTFLLNTVLLQEDENITATLDIPTFGIVENNLSAENISGNFDLFKSGRTLQGKLTSPLNIDFEKQTVNLGNIASNMSGTHPILSNRLTANLTGNLQINYAEQNAKLNLKAKVDDSNIAGNIGLTSFSQPYYSFDLGTNILDLDRYLVADWAKRWKDDDLPFDFSSLKNMNFHGKIRSNEFKFTKISLRNFYTEIKAEQSTLTIEPINARLYGGSTSGGFTIIASDIPKITVKQKLNGIQINSLLTDLVAGEPKFTGKGNITYDLTGTGTNMGSLRKSINGNASFTLGQGAIAGINLAESLIAGKNKLGVKDAKQSEIAKFTESTPFAELKSTFDIADGKAINSDFLLKSPLLNSKGAGEVSLVSGQLDYRLNTTVSAALKKSSNGEIAELKGMTIPMQLNGKLSAPNIIFDFAAASGGVKEKTATSKVTKAAVPVTVKKKSATK